MTEPAFLWTLTVPTESLSILLWSKFVAVANGSQVTRFDTHPSAVVARAVAIEQTAVADGFGLRLASIYAHEGGDGLPDLIAMVHQLHIGGEKKAASIVMNAVITRIVHDGVSLDG